MLLSSIDTSQSYLCISASEHRVDVFIFNRFKALLFHKQVNLEELPQQSIHAKTFYRTFISVNEGHTLASLVPQAIFLESESSRYLSFVTNQSSPAPSVHQLASHAEYLYTKTKLHIFLETLFSQADVFPEAYFLIKNLAYYRSIQPESVLLHKQHGVVYIMAYSDDKILFFNGFDVQSAEDISYYTLLTYNQCQLNTTKTPLLMSGAISKTDSEFDLLSLYLGKIELCSIPLHVQGMLEESDLRTHSALLTTLLCES